MTCEETRDRLDDYVDGALGEAELHEVELHLAACAACADEERRLRAVVARAAALPREMTPPRDLWPGIADRIAAGRQRPAARVVRPRLVVEPGGAGGGGRGARGAGGHARPRVDARRRRPKGGTGVLQEAAWTADPSLLAAEREYARATAQLLAALEARQATLPPETVAAVERDLAHDRRGPAPGCAPPCGRTRTTRSSRTCWRPRTRRRSTCCRASCGCRHGSDRREERHRHYENDSGGGAPAPDRRDAARRRAAEGGRAPPGRGRRPGGDREPGRHAARDRVEPERGDGHGHAGAGGRGVVRHRREEPHQRGGGDARQPPRRGLHPRGPRPRGESSGDRVVRGEHHGLQRQGHGARRERQRGHHGERGGRRGGRRRP